MDDHRIRIILEGIDKLSGVFKGSRKEIDKEIQGIQTKIRDLNKDLKDADTELQGIGSGKVFKSSSGQFSSIDKTRKEVERLNDALKDLKAQAREGSKRERLSQFFGSAGQGFKEAKEQGQRLAQALSTERQIVKEKRAAIDAETRSEQILLNNRKEATKQRLNEIKFNRGEKLAESQQERKNALADAILKKNQIAALEKLRLESEAKTERAAIKLEAKLQTTPISIERAKAVRANKEEQIKLLDLERNEINAARDLDVRRVDEELARNKILVNNKVNQEKDGLRRIVADRERIENAELKRINTKLTKQVETASRTVQNQFNETQAGKRLAVGSPDAAAIRAGEQELRRLNNAAHENDNAFQKAGRSIGLWTGDLRRGLKEGRKGLVEFGSDIQKAESRLTRLGQNVGRVVGQFGNLINLRWFFLTSIIQVLGTLVAQLAAAFISLASSAALAGAAIGSAMAAAASQALPVVGLLAAAFARVQSVMKAVQLQNQNEVSGETGTASLIAQRNATEQLSDAQYALKQAYNAVAEAQYNIGKAAQGVSEAILRNKNAVYNLGQVRISVSRAIVDSYFDERDAALALQSAELGVVDAKKRLLDILKKQKTEQSSTFEAQGAVREAKQRLEAAIKEGDQAEISGAQQQLSIAEKSLSTIADNIATTKNDIKEARVGVKQAELDRDRAKVDNKRTKEDSKKLRDDGLKGNRDYIAAQKEVVDSIKAISDARHGQVQSQLALNAALHQEFVARRSLRDIQADKKAGVTGTIPGEQQLEALKKQFSPSEKQLFDSLTKIQAAYKKAFRPVTDIIVSAFSRAVDRTAILLKDPKLIDAAKILASAIGAGIDSISKATLDPEFRKSLVVFITEAAKNMPLVVSSFIHLLHAFTALAQIGSPLFRRFLEFVERLTGRFDKFLNNDKKAGDFFKLANKNLNAWLKLGEAIGRIFLALGKGSNKAGLTLIEDFTNFLDRIADWMEKHPKKVQNFFDDSAKNFERVAAAFADLAPVLFKAFTSKEATDFIVFVTEIIIPGLLLMTKTIQTVASVLLSFTEIPIIGQLGKWILQFLLFEKAMNKVFPATQHITNLFKLAFVKGPREAIKEFGKLFPFFTKIIKSLGLVGRAVIVFSRLLLGLIVANPVIAAIVAIIAILVILQLKFHIFTRAFTYVREHWRQGWNAMQNAVTNAINFIKRLITRFVDFIKDHWKTIARILIAIFVPGGIILLAIERWHNKMIGFAKSVVAGIVGAFKGIGSTIIDFFTGIPARIIKIFKGLGKKIVSEVIDKIPGLRKVMDAAGKVAGGVKKGATAVVGGALGAVGIGHWRGGTVRAFGAGGDVPGATDTVPAMLTPGEWVLNVQQQNKLAKRLGEAPGAIARYLFGKRDGSTVSDLDTKGGLVNEGTSKPPMVVTPGDHPGMVRPGNINLLNRKVAKNADGSISTVRSISVGIGNGLFALIPTVINGKVVSDPRAKAEFRRTGKNLGIFNNEKLANVYAKQLHNQQASAYTKKYDGYSGPNFTLIPRTDDNGNVIWFAEFGDKTFGQISTKDANKMLATNGNYIPKYLTRSSIGHKGLLPGHLKKMTVAKSALKGTAARVAKNNQFAMGGIVGKSQSFAKGGPVINSPAGGQRGGNTIHQNFNVQTQGETDWNYAMRLGAIHAKEY